MRCSSVTGGAALTIFWMIPSQSGGHGGSRAGLRDGSVATSVWSTGALASADCGRVLSGGGWRFRPEWCLGLPLRASRRVAKFLQSGQFADGLDQMAHAWPPLNVES